VPVPLGVDSRLSISINDTNNVIIINKVTK